MAQIVFSCSGSRGLWGRGVEIAAELDLTEELWSFYLIFQAHLRFRHLGN